MPDPLSPRTESTLAGLGRFLRRLFAIGFAWREGTLRLERIQNSDEPGGLPPDFTGLGTVKVWYRVRFVEQPERVQGFVHASRLLNRAQAGERVAIQLDPDDGFIRKIRPLDRRLGWWQN